MTSFTVNTYSPKDVTLVLGKDYVLAGWNTITISRNQDGYIPVRGIKGKNTRVRNRDTSATISFSCLQTSLANDIMSEIHTQDILTGVARLVITLKDASGTSLFTSQEAYITGYPEVVFSGDFEYRIWNIFCQTTDATYTVGGNTRGETKLFDSAVQTVTNFVGDLF